MENLFEGQNNKTDLEHYTHYRDLLREALYSHHKRYKTKQSQLLLFEAYQIIRELGETIPEWILVGVDNYATSKIKQDSKKRKRRTDAMKILDYIKIKQSKDSAAAKKNYASRESISITAVEKRMNKWRQKPESF